MQFLPENKPIFSHRVDNPRHGEHGAEHGHGQPCQGAYRHDDFAFECPHLTEHFDQGRILIHLVVRNWNMDFKVYNAAIRFLDVQTETREAQLT